MPSERSGATPLSLTEGVGDAPSRLMEERERVRAALGDMVVEIDPRQFFPRVSASASPSRLEDLPRLDPPLSAIVVEERADRL